MSTALSDYTTSDEVQRRGVNDAHHPSLAQYTPGQDKGLDMHTDDSDVTYNVCLGREFEADARARSCCHFAPTLIHSIQDPLR